MSAFPEKSSIWHEADQQLKFHDWVALGAAERQLPLKVRKPTAEMLKYFEEITLKEDDGAQTRHVRERIYAGRIAKLKDAPDEIRVPLQAMRIGNLGIAAVPFETFAETGLELKDRSPFGQTFTIELANGSFGYLPTPEQHRLGGYETWLGTNYVEKEASMKIVTAILDLFQTLHQNGTKNWLGQHREKNDDGDEDGQARPLPEATDPLRLRGTDDGGSGQGDRSGHADGQPGPGQ